MKPTVGRIVYFNSEFSDEVRAAIITSVEDADKEIVSLSVFHPDIIEFKQHVEHGETVNQWDWMPYQKGQAKKTEELEQKLAEQVVNDNIGKVARLCHEVNRAYCRSIGDDSQPSWEEAPQWQKDSAINGVKFHLENETTPEQSHENWLKVKKADGWVYGPEKDPEKKEHPCMVPYNELPIEQRTKDHLFKAIVDTCNH